MIALDSIINADCLQVLPSVDASSVHLILSDIPYGICQEEWDVLHENTNSALLGASPAQKKAGKIFKSRGKPLNGWSEADRMIPRQYYDWCCSWAAEWFRVLVPGGNAFVFAGRRFAHRCITAMEDAGFTFKDMLAWDKGHAPLRAQRIRFVYEKRNDMKSAEKWDGWRTGNLRPVFEPILWFCKPYKIGGTIADNLLQHGVGAYNEEVLRKYGQTNANIFHVSPSSSDSGLHPTQKPLRLMELLIELSTSPEQLVLDPFCGSGTTLAAAMQLNRHYIGIEKNETYFLSAQNRLNELRQEQDLLLFKSI